MLFVSYTYITLHRYFTGCVCMYYSMTIYLYVCIYLREQNEPGEHGVWMSLLNLSTELLDILAGPMVSIPLRRLLLQWQRAAEFSCDRAALLVAQDYKV